MFNLYPPIIFTITTCKYCNTNYQNNWGIGDMIKGLNSLFLLCSSMKIPFFVDFSTHPIQNFLQSVPHPYEEFVKEHLHEAIFLDHNTNLQTFLNDKNFITRAPTTPCLLFTNVDSHNYSEESKEFVKSAFLNFSSTFLNAWSTKIPKDEYSILHFRLGDNFINSYNIDSNSNDYDGKFNDEIAVFRVYTEPHDVLISDSKTFKAYVAKHSDCKMFDLDICHLGYQVDEKSLQAIEHTLFDLFLVSRSKKIKSHSIYNWESGFVREISKIYNIEFINLKRAERN